MAAYLASQIITYLGNKRKLLPHIADVVDLVKKELNALNFTAAEGFSGSGVVSRLLKTRVDKLYVNDLAHYSYTLSQCYLSTPTAAQWRTIRRYISEANIFVETCDDQEVTPWIQRHWAPCGEINKKDRVYFTEENAKRIDRYRHFIATLPKEYRPYLLGPLLAECSIHANTNGQFSAFHKKDGKGCFGGRTGTDIKRITQAISLQEPVLSSSRCDVVLACQDTNKWIREIPPVDLVYYDPPYNKHPYAIYYFLLDIINDWDTDSIIPDTYRGQPKTWRRSAYNSYVHAKKAMEDLISHTNAAFILLSYNNGGIIPLPELEQILEKHGTVHKIPVIHKTYNKLKGIANYKRTNERKEIKEFLWLIDTRSH